MKPGDIINIFTDPYRMELSKGKAILVAPTGVKVESSNGQLLIKLEEWNVEFLDCPGKTYTRLIKVN